MNDFDCVKFRIRRRPHAQESRNWRRAWLTVILASALWQSAVASPADPLKLREEAIREQMVQISAQLGATCIDCHSLKNFADASNPRFAKAKAHIEIVEILKARGFDGKKSELASCTFCHQGRMVPDWLAAKAKSESEAPPAH